MRRKRPAWAALFLTTALLGIGCARVASDKQIATSIQARMFSDPQLRGSALNVEVKQGVATLSGQVTSVAARYEAFKVASETPGVKNVDDEMTIQESPENARAAPTIPAPAPESEPRPRESRPHRVIRRAEPSADENASSQAPGVTTPAAPASEAQPESSAAPPASDENTGPTQPAPQPERITIPEGTEVDVQTIDSVNTAVNHTGDILHASLATPITIDNQVVAPAGSDVYLHLVQVHSAGHYAGQSELRLELYRIVIQGTSYPIVSNDYVDKGTSRTKRSVLTILGGSAIGAAIGAIAGGGKGAAIGAATGGGAGTVYQGVSKSPQIDIPPETLLKFQLAQPASVTLNPNDSQPNRQP